MKRDYISDVLHIFFGNKYSSGTTEKVHQWIAEDKYSDTKDQVMNDIWNSLPQNIDQSDYRSLKEVKSRLGMSDRGRKHMWIHSKITRIAAVLIPAILILGAAYFYKVSQSHSELQQVSVVNGESRQLLLPDGSEVWLNAGSTLSYPEQFDGDTRDVTLSGEATFSVKSDEKHAFIVKTASLTVEVLGTVFNIEAYPGDDKSVATLNRGKVKVKVPEKGGGIDNSYILNPDQQLVLDEEKNVSVRTVNSQEVLDWRNGHLVFQDATIKEIMNRLKRHYNISVDLNYYTLKDDQYSIRFVNNENIRQVMDVLQNVVGDFTYTIKGSEITLYQKEYKRE